MTLAELLALLGRSWSRLVLYPGGLALLGSLLFLGYQTRRGAGGRWSTQTSGLDQPPNLVDLTMIAAPWLGVALMPLPLAASVGRSLDVVVALALLEWPRLLLAIREAHAGQVGRLAALLNSYPPLIGALLLLALPGGSLDLGSIGQPPGTATSQLSIAGYWFGSLALILALPAVVGLGPFAHPPPLSSAARLGLALRASGMVALAGVPWAGLIPEALRWLLPLPLIVLLVGCWAFNRRFKQKAALPWAQALLWLCAIELTIVLLASVEGLSLRLR